VGTSSSLGKHSRVGERNREPSHMDKRTMEDPTMPTASVNSRVCLVDLHPGSSSWISTLPILHKEAYIRCLVGAPFASLSSRRS